MNRIIHHIWPGSDVFRYPDYRLTWMKYNPDWHFFFWRIANLPFDKMLPCVKQIVIREDISYVVKSDILRWEMLRIYGGIYVDTDMECLRSFDEFLKYKSFCGKVKDKACNAIIGMNPDNSLIKFIENLCSNVLKDPRSACDSYYGVMNSTGPSATRNYLDSLEVVFDEKYFYKLSLGSYSVHHWKNAEPGGWTYLLRQKERDKLRNKS